MFVHILAADDKCSLLNRENLNSQIQVQWKKKKKAFSKFVSAFLKSVLNFEYFQIKYDFHSWCISEITDFKKRG